MASYIYTSVSGKNWDDDDDDLDSAVYSGAVAELGAPEKAKSTLSNARLALQELEKESTIEFEQQHARNSTSTVMQSKVDYNNIDKDYWPTSAGHATQSWFSSGPPAYTALSTDRGYVYPYERRNYNANWMTTKLRMSANMKRTAMMAPSNLNLSKTWVSDSLGEYVEDRGYEYLSLPTLRTSTPRLAHENESDEERDEAQTPPDTPSMAKAGKCDVEVEVSEIIRRAKCQPLTCCSTTRPQTQSTCMCRTSSPWKLRWHTASPTSAASQKISALTRFSVTLDSACSTPRPTRMPFDCLYPTSRRDQLSSLLQSPLKPSSLFHRKQTRRSRSRLPPTSNPAAAMSIAAMSLPTPTASPGRLL
jgi:hypothetical protein